MLQLMFDETKIISVESRKKCVICKSKSCDVIVGRTLYLCKHDFNQYLYKKFKRTVRDFKVMFHNCRVCFELDYTYNSIFLASMLYNLKQDFPFSYMCNVKKEFKSRFDCNEKIRSLISENIYPVHPIKISKCSIIFEDDSADDVAAYVLKSLLSKNSKELLLNDYLKTQKKGQITVKPCWQISAYEMREYCRINFDQIFNYLKNKQPKKGLTKMTNLLSIANQDIPFVCKKVIKFKQKKDAILFASSFSKKFKK